jgi:hypothetical protein
VNVYVIGVEILSRLIPRLAEERLNAHSRSVAEGAPKIAILLIASELQQGTSQSILKVFYML